MERKPAFYISASNVPKMIWNWGTVAAAPHYAQFHHLFSQFLSLNTLTRRATTFTPTLPCLFLRFAPTWACKWCTIAKTEPKNELSAEQRGVSHPLHLVHFSFSINKCFHLHSSLSLTHRAHMNHGGWWATKLRRSLWKHGTRCIFHEALDAVLFMPVSSAVLFGSWTIDSWHSDGGLE